MKEVERMLKEIIKVSKDKQAQYWYGVEFCGHNKPDYRARILYSKRLESVLFGADSLPKLKEKIKRYIDNGNVKDSVIAYCEAQIELSKNDIRFNLNLIKEYEEKEKKKNENKHS
jgi:hypothetical protein